MPNRHYPFGQVPQQQAAQGSPSAQVAALHRRASGHEGRLAALEGFLQQWAMPQKIRESQGGIGNQFDRIPGRRIPWTEKLEIPFAHLDDRVAEASVTIPVDGSAVFESISAYWRVTDTTDEHFSDVTASNWTGRLLPISAFGTYVRNAVDTGGAAIGFMTDIPEIDLQLITSSTGKSWSKLSVPGPDFSAIDKHPIMPYGYANAQEAFTVRATTHRAIPHAGTVEVVAKGYQILGQLNLSDALDKMMRSDLEAYKKFLEAFPMSPGLHPGG